MWYNVIEVTMSLLQSIDKNKIGSDIRYKLFLNFTLISAVLSIVFFVVHTVNLRPMVNIVTAFIVGLVCFALYFLGKKEVYYNIARLMLLVFFAVFYVPLSYFTTPGTQSAMPYLMLLVTFVLSIMVVNKWEYLFPCLINIEAIILFRLELNHPEWLDVYEDPAFRITDLSINYTVVSFAIILSLVYLMREYNEHSKGLYDISITDSLTGLYNKRYFDDFAEMEYNRSIREGHVFSIIFIDINNFKNINNEFGHPVGDRVLKDIGKIIMNNIRSYDICARYGGDEFIAILPNTSKQDAIAHIERMEEIFKDYAQKYVDQGFAVGLGYTDSKDKTLEEVIQMADQLLYEDKSNKRK